MEPITVAMSGGVDSTVAAHRLLAEDRAVSGVTMRLLPEGASESHEVSLAAAEAAALSLGVSHTILDLSDDFERLVISRMAAQYAAGLTPNPCVVCNEQIKFGLLFGWALDRGGLFGTGHYARTEKAPSGENQLLRAADASKDQSYFLYRLPAETLERTLFPLGDSLKSDVIEEALALGLSAASRPESQDVCFTDESGLLRFVLDRFPSAEEPGPIVNEAGEVLGTHRGLARYTVGQRKGIGVAASEPLHVLSIDGERNQLIVGPVDALDVDSVVATDIVWRGPREEPVPCEVRVRYRGPSARGTATVRGEELSIALDSPLRGVAPGQAVVCYAEDVCLGGGEIRATDDRLPRSHEEMRSRIG